MSRVAIVTGAAGGIGAPLCRALAEDGYAVVAADFAEDAGQALAQELGAADGRAAFYKYDVRDPRAAEALAAETIQRYGIIDVLINAAGVMSRIPTLEMPEQEWDRVLDINLKGTFLCSQAAARRMVAAGSGRIVCLASGRGIAGQPRAAHYAASKAGVIGFVKSLAAELAPHGIRVNTISPGNMATEMHFDELRDRAARSGRSFEDELDAARADVPLGRHGTGEDIAGAVVWLASEDSAYITGQTIGVNGGILLS